MSEDTNIEVELRNVNSYTTMNPLKKYDKGTIYRVDAKTAAELKAKRDAATGKRIFFNPTEPVERVVLAEEDHTDLPKTGKITVQHEDPNSMLPDHQKPLPQSDAELAGLTTEVDTGVGVTIGGDEEQEGDEELRGSEEGTKTFIKLSAGEDGTVVTERVEGAEAVAATEASVTAEPAETTEKPAAADPAPETTQAPAKPRTGKAVVSVRRASPTQPTAGDDEVQV